MRILLDTHVYLWCVNNDAQLSTHARSLILDSSEVYVSSASIWEIGIKVKLGKLNADINELMHAIEKSGFLELPISMQHAAEVYQLPNLHRDPFDRILLAQALCEPLKLLTSDKKLREYSSLVEVI